MRRLLSSRWSLITLFFICAALLGYGYYLEYFEYLEPCPLCYLQRYCFMGVGIISLVAGIHHPARVSYIAYNTFGLFFSLAGTAIAGRHVYLQYAPLEEIPECLPGLDYMLSTMSFGEVFAKIFKGSGDCLTVDWQFLGLSMPAWALIWFIILSMLLILITAWIRR